MKSLFIAGAVVTALMFGASTASADHGYRFGPPRNFAPHHHGHHFNHHHHHHHRGMPYSVYRPMNPYVGGYHGYRSPAAFGGYGYRSGFGAPPFYGHPAYRNNFYAPRSGFSLHLGF